MTSEDEITGWLLIAKEAVLRAGTFLSKRNQHLVNIDVESRRDIKIRADKESERIILEYLKEKSDFSILSEESGIIERKGHRFTWIVDPLDGSLNYARGIPFCCVSVGLWQGDNPMLGAVYDFNNLDLFTGITGKGAWLNEKNIGVSSIDKKENAVLCTGFPINTDFSKESLMNFIQKVRKYKKIRLLGSAALSIAYVASGRADDYYEENIMIWDIAGGLPIVLGAGGDFSIKKTSRMHSYHVTASNGYLEKLK